MAEIASTRILASFCNAMPGMPSLALLDPTTSEVQVLRVPERVSRLGGLAGVALSEEFLFAVTPRSALVGRAGRRSGGPSCLLAFDRRTLALRAEHVCARIVDGHSMWRDGSALYVVSTGTDQVVRVELDGPRVVGEEVVWQPEGHEPDDLHHLNAIHPFHGNLLLSGFGKKSAERWSSAHDGFVLDLRTGERLAGGLRHPHSLFETEGRLFLCESGKSTVRVLGENRASTVPGYLRGLCRLGDVLFVGTSRGRTTSKSDPTLTNRGDPGALAGRCSIVALSLGDLAIRETIDLDDLAWEIYDLLPVDGTDEWPVLADLEWRDEALRGLRGSFDERDETISWLHGEVAARDETVRWLHREVAERDSKIASLQTATPKPPR